MLFLKVSTNFQDRFSSSLIMLPPESLVTGKRQRGPSHVDPKARRCREPSQCTCSSRYQAVRVLLKLAFKEPDEYNRIRIVISRTPKLVQTALNSGEHVREN